MKRALPRIVGIVFVVAVLAVALASWRAGDAGKSHGEVLAQLERLGDLLAAEDLRAEDVSAWSVHDHVEHLLRADEGILGRIAAGTPPEEEVPMTMQGRIVLLTGVIPRGRGQAPESTVPEGLAPDEARALLERVVAAARAVDPGALPEGVVGNHAVFGGLDAARWLRLMSVHDEHHLAIIEDIRAAAGPASDA